MRPYSTATRTSAIAGCRRLLVVGAVAIAALLIVPVAQGADRIYFSNFTANQIAWANLNGSGGETVDTTGATVKGPMGLTIDPAHGRIYWANWANHSGTTISYANLDGSGGHDLITDIGSDPSAVGPEGTAIDPATRKIYWSDFGGNKLIQFANSNGTGISSPSMHLRQLSKPIAGSSFFSTWPPCTITPAAPTWAAAFRYCCRNFRLGIRIRLLVVATFST